MIISSTLTVIICLINSLCSMTIFITDVNIIEESMKMFEQSMKTSMRSNEFCRTSTVPENVEQTNARFN